MLLQEEGQRSFYLLSNEAIANGQQRQAGGRVWLEPRKVYVLGRSSDSRQRDFNRIQRHMYNLARYKGAGNCDCKELLRYIRAHCFRRPFLMGKSWTRSYIAEGRLPNFEIMSFITLILFQCPPFSPPVDSERMFFVATDVFVTSRPFFVT